jgi:adenine-specific DNA-methyltransferase
MEQQLFELQNKGSENPSLSWVGKRLSIQIPLPSLEMTEQYTPGWDPDQSTENQASYTEDNLLLHGDNLQTLAWLLSKGYQGKVRLIYIDPPFDSDGVYTSAVRLRGAQGRLIGSTIQYNDRWQGGDFLQFMAERLLLLKELLHPDGTLWLHCDHRASARLQLLLEEIFGPESYLNTIAWRSQVARGAKVHARFFPRSTHSIHIFARGAASNPTWHPPRREILLTRAEAAAQYKEDAHGFFRTSHPGTYSFEKLVELDAEGRIYAPYNGSIIVDSEQRRVYASNGGNIGVKYYLKERNRNSYVVTQAVDNLWEDIPGLGTIPSEDVNYPTQKTEGLLRRILETASDPGDLVLDAFVGSGTSVAVAQKLGRRWIGCDENWGAIRTTASRIQRNSGNGAASTAFRIYRGEGASRPQPETQVALSVERLDELVTIAIQHYANPALNELLHRAGEPIPADWRALVQSISIDPDYDGRAFRPRLLDLPSGREEMVRGSYRLPHPATDRIALCIVDILGQETLLTSCSHTPPP